MKIQCDVCNREEASLFCSADEAALCHGCDQRVHHANKLASKHPRFSLLYPSCKDDPRCDICQEKRAFLFCREDRAILCKECDFSIHTANENTKVHNRFLLPGVKLSFSTNSTSSSSDVSIDSTISNKSQPSMKKNKNTLVPVSPELHDPPPPPPPPPPPIENTSPSPTPSKGGGYVVDHTKANEGGSTSSISEYLTQMLPGWHVEDFLDSPTNGFCKSDDDLFLDDDLEPNLHCFPSEDLSIWVPQAPFPHPSQIDEQQNGLFKELKELFNPIPKVSKRLSDHGFTVPQISPPSNKRSRFPW